MSLVINAFAQGIEKSGIEPANICFSSDIPFEADVVRFLGVDFFHVPRGRAIAFGSGMKLANPALTVVTIAGDLMTLGGNHFVHACRRNVELVVVCVNNFTYKKIAGKPVPSSPSSFSPYSTFEEPFNMPHLGNSCGATYTARWTALHGEELANSFAECLCKHGLSLIEILAPGPSYYAGIKSTDAAVLNFYHEHSVVKNNENPRNVEITPDAMITVGKFTDKEAPTFIDIYNAQLSKILGSKFTPYGVPAKAKGG